MHDTKRQPNQAWLKFIVDIVISSNEEELYANYKGRKVIHTMEKLKDVN